MKHLAPAFACLWLWSVAASAAPPVEAYAQLPATDLVTLSPSGERIAMVSGIGDKRMVVVRGTADGKLVKALKIDDIKVRDLQWAGDEHLVVLTSVTKAGGLYVPGEWYSEELFNAAVLNLNTGAAFVVFFHASDLYPVVFNPAGYRQVDGHWYGYFDGATVLDSTFSKARGNIGVISLYQVDLDTGTYRIAGEGDRTWLLKRDGTPLVHAGIHRDKGMNQWELYDGRFEHDLIEKQDTPLGGIHLTSLGRTADTYLIQRELTPDAGLWERSLTPGTAPVSLTSAAIASVIQDSQGLAIGAELEGDTTESLLFDPARKAAFENVKQAFAPAHVQFLSFDASGKRMVVLSSSATDSGTYYMVDLAHQKVERIGAAYPQVQDRMIGATSMVHYKAADGLALDGILTLPPGSTGKNLPLVVLPHGGPEARDHLGFDWIAQSFAARGYAVFQPNYRGSGGFGIAFRNAGFGEWGRKMQTDNSDGVAELARQGTIDPRRVAIVGFSYGGYAALAGVTVQHGLYRCAVSYGGISDLNGFMSLQAGADGSEVLQNDSIFVRTLHRYMGTDSNGSAAVDALSPAKRAADADAPILLIYGANDTVVSPRQSEGMAKALNAAGKPAELIKLPDEDHWLSRGPSRIAALKAAVDFVEKYNPATTTQ